MTKRKKLHFIIGSVLTLLIVVTVFFAIKASASGDKLTSLEQQASELLEQNRELQMKIVVATSLSQIEKKAKNIGMGVPHDFIYLSDRGVALR